MQREALRQRIHYLIEHGGAYPEEPCTRRSRDWVVIGMLALVALLELAQLLS